MEKNGSKRHYFSSNKHDAASEIIHCEARLEMLCNGTKGFPSCERQKHPYQKHDSEYWNGGIQEAQRKRQHTDYLHVSIQNGFSKSHPYAMDLTLMSCLFHYTCTILVCALKVDLSLSLSHTHMPHTYTHAHVCTYAHAYPRTHA